MKNKNLVKKELYRKNLSKIVLIPILMMILAVTSHTHAKRFNMSYLYGNYNYSNLVSQTGNSLNEVSPSYFDLYTSGNLDLNTVDTDFVAEMHSKGIKVVPFLSNHWNKEKGRNALNNIEKLTDQLVDAIQKYNLDGVNVDIENVTEVDRENYTLFVKTLRQKLGNGKIIAVAVAANPYNWQTGWHGSYDYAGLAKYADYLMVMTYDEHYEGGEAGPIASIDFVEKSIQYALERVNPEKIVLGIPFFGRYWKEGTTYGGYGVSLTKIDSLFKKYKNYVTYDEKTQSVKAIMKVESHELNPSINGKTLYTGTYTFWYENERSISAKLDLVNKYNLKGTGSWSLGQELPSTWNYYTTKLNEGIQNNTVDDTSSKEEINLQKASSWAVEAIEYVKNNGWMNGKSETEFYPKDDLTRAEFATIISRILNLEQYKVKEYVYPDSEGHWAEKAIGLVTVAGYMRGYDDYTFKPNKEITREEVATVLANMKLKDESEYKIIEFPYFYDLGPNNWSYESVMKIARLGILKGYENGNFEPKKPISREEMAVILQRAI